ncbi:anti-sigma factor [Solihabitans fulvus]|uniref:Anti-sigma factor n=1 Tax=Solihabitans fulvus TaxID=1892852 RepID=A0A5B2WJ45_9PSEU|nr:zf-HC2 domain-containing protein [Solihabitans fulvus]KAA2250924.1 anti-sigma factor [Solihabitans fulvus]
MIARQHETIELGAYALGVLAEDERRAVEEHLAGCEQCRAELAELTEMQAALGEVPPELFLDGPPDGGDLLLQRTLREVRGERTSVGRRRATLLGVAAAAAVVVALGAGIMIGNAGDTGSSGAVAVSQQPPPTNPSPPAGTRVGTNTDSTTNVRLSVTVTPAVGWVRVNAAVTGIPAGERCRLVVVAKDGTREVAGSWLVSEKGAKEGSTLDGSALIAPGDVASVQVENVDGKRFVSTQL